MDTLGTFRLSPLCCYLSAWFLYLPLLLSFSAHHWISQLIHLSISQNLACSGFGNLIEELRMSDSMAGENKFPCSILQYIWNWHLTTPPRHRYHQQLPYSSAGLSPSTKYPRAEDSQQMEQAISCEHVCVLSMMIPFYAMAPFSLQSICCFHYFKYKQTAFGERSSFLWNPYPFLWEAIITCVNGTLHSLAAIATFQRQQGQRHPQISSLEEIRALSLHTSIQSSPCHSLSLLHPFPPLYPEKLHVLIFS